MPEAETAEIREASKHALEIINGDLTARLGIFENGQVKPSFPDELPGHDDVEAVMKQARDNSPEDVEAFCKVMSEIRYLDKKTMIRSLWNLLENLKSSSRKHEQKLYIGTDYSNNTSGGIVRETVKLFRSQNPDFDFEPLPIDEMDDLKMKAGSRVVFLDDWRISGWREREFFDTLEARVGKDIFKTLFLEANYVVAGVTEASSDLYYRGLKVHKVTAAYGVKNLNELADHHDLAVFDAMISNSQQNTDFDLMERYNFPAVISNIGPHDQFSPGLLFHRENGKDTIFEKYTARGELTDRLQPITQEELKRILDLN